MTKFFGGEVVHRNHKCKTFDTDLRKLVELLMHENVYVRQFNRDDRKILKVKKGTKATEPATAVVDLIAEGAETWGGGKAEEYLRSSCYDPKDACPISTIGIDGLDSAQESTE